MRNMVTEAVSLPDIVICLTCCPVCDLQDNVLLKCCNIPLRIDCLVQETKDESLCCLHGTLNNCALRMCNLLDQISGRRCCPPAVILFDDAPIQVIARLIGEPSVLPEIGILVQELPAHRLPVCLVVCCQVLHQLWFVRLEAEFFPEDLVDSCLGDAEPVSNFAAAFWLRRESGSLIVFHQLHVFLSLSSSI